jgi:DNA-binding response OmpR family regulator
MHAQGRILIVDDDPEWQNLLTVVLQGKGLYADAVGTRAAMDEHLRMLPYHVLILDIRLIDLDANNEEGMDILRNLKERDLLSAFRIIMISAYGTKAQMRESFRDFGIADFLSKHEFNPDEFLDIVHQQLQELHINLNLQLFWKGSFQAAQSVNGMTYLNERITQSTPELMQHAAADLEDLIRRLFYNCTQVIMQPLAPGASGTRILWGQPFYHDQGGARAVIVKYGDIPRILQEEKNFKSFVEPFIGGGRNTDIRAVRQTTNLAGILYSFLGVSGEQLDDFGNFYERADATIIQKVLEELFLDTCGRWYESPGHLEPHDLSTEYEHSLNIDLERLQHAVEERLKTVQGKQEIHFHNLSSSRAYPNPLLALSHERIVRSTYHCTTHGDFNIQNILIDHVGHSWLIDFFRTGRGHILRDIGQLDAFIRIQLLKEEHATLDERAAMEELLCSAEQSHHFTTLTQTMPTHNEHVMKTLEVVCQLRALAQRLVPQQRVQDVDDYLVATLYPTLKMIGAYRLSKMQREHALLSAAVIVERLGLRVR